MSDRVHRWLLDPGSIYEVNTARLADLSIQHRRVERAAEIGKHWPELSVARKRAVLTALIERIEVSVDQIDIRLRPRLGWAPCSMAMLHPSQGVGEEESELLSVPVRLRRAGREMKIVIDGTDRFATAKPDARLVKLLLRARVQCGTHPGRRHRLCRLAQREGVSPSSSPRLVASALLRQESPGDPRWAAAARSDAREAPSSTHACRLPGTLSGPRSALVQPALSAKIYRTIELGEGPDFIGTGVAFSPTRSAALRYWNMARQRYCHRLARSRNTLRVSADPGAEPTAHSRAESPSSWASKAERDRDGLSAGGRNGFEPSVPHKKTTLFGCPRSVPQFAFRNKNRLFRAGTDGSNLPSSRQKFVCEPEYRGQARLPRSVPAAALPGARAGCHRWSGRA